VIFHSINPYTEQSIAKHSTFSESEVNDKIAQSEKAFLIWRNIDVDKRLDYIKNIRNILIEKKNECASIITEEMGKVLVESQLEIDKCIWLCDYFI